MTSDINALFQTNGNTGERSVRCVMGECLLKHEVRKAVGSGVRSEAPLRVHVQHRGRGERLARALGDQFGKRELEYLLVLVCQRLGVSRRTSRDLVRKIAFLLCAARYVSSCSGQRDEVTYQTARCSAAAEENMVVAFKQRKTLRRAWSGRIAEGKGNYIIPARPAG